MPVFESEPGVGPDPSSGGAASARDAIANTLSLYAWAYDRDELDLIGSCFTDDAEVEFGTGWKTGREAVVAELRRRRDVYRPTGAIPWHVISNVLVHEEHEATARVTSFYTFFVKRPGEAPAPQSIGHYDDLFAVEEGAWRIRRRSVVAAE